MVIPAAVAMLLLGLAIFSYTHGRHHGRYLRFAVTNQIDAHAERIATLLSETHGTTPSQIEDAVFEELRHPYSTSLITREMVSVRRSTGAVWECVIDTRSLGLEARRIQAKVAVGPRP